MSVFLLYTFFQKNEPRILPVARETRERAEQSFFLELWAEHSFSTEWKIPSLHDKPWAKDGAWWWEDDSQGLAT